MEPDPFKKKPLPIEEKPRQETSPKEKYKSSPQEILLGLRQVERMGEFLGGIIGEARFVKIVDDGGGVFKPHTRYENPRRIEFINKERAAYLVSRFLGFDFVPPTIIKTINGQVGSLQEFVEDAQTGNETSSEDILSREQLKLDVFDDLVGNGDRHGNNYLVKNGKIIAIDNGFAFDDIEDFRKPVIIQDDIPVDLADKLRKFASSQEQQDILRDLLAELLDDKIVDLFMKRVIVFIKSIKPDNTFDN
jgi:hypothetical protein